MFYFRSGFFSLFFLFFVSGYLFAVEVLVFVSMDLLKKYYCCMLFVVVCWVFWGIFWFGTEFRKEGNVLFNDALNTFYLQLYGVKHMVKDHSDSERGNPLPPHGLLFPISSKGSFICTIPQTEREQGVVAIHLPIGFLKTRSGSEPVPRCEPSTYH